MSADDRTMTKDWAPPRKAPERLADEDLRRWRGATAKVREIAEARGWSKSEVARRAGIPDGTFSPWYDGVYGGVVANQTVRVERWLESVDEQARFRVQIGAPDFIRTPTSNDILNILSYAQAMPCMGLVVLGPGMGKTATARHYAATRPNTTLVTMRPTTARTRSMLADIGRALKVAERNPVALDCAIGEKLKRNGRQCLLIVDEAQHLVDTAVNQLRYWHDEYAAGIVLMGNEELDARFGGHEPKAGYAQLHRRRAMRLHRLTPRQADIDAYVAAWGIADPDVVALARAIGRKPGALGQIRETLVLAQMLAASDDHPLTVEHVRAAWENRGGELPDVARRTRVGPARSAHDQSQVGPARSDSAA